MNPYAILTVVIIFVCSLSGTWVTAYSKGRHDQKANDALIQQTANEAASKALANIKNDLQPKITNYYKETTKYPDCYHTDAGWDALNAIYDSK